MNNDGDRMTAKKNIGMSEEHLIELINKEIDGLISASEHQELMQSVSSNEHAAQLYHDLLRTAKALEGIEQAPPPAYLKSHIMNSINAAPALADRSVGWLSSWIGVFRAKPMARYAVVFASGLCVGILFLVLASAWQQNAEPDASTVSGYIALFSDIHRLPVVESARFGGEGVEGVFRTYRSGGNVFVEIEVQSSEKFSIELNSDPAELRFDGIRRFAGAEGDVNVTQGKIILSGARSEQAVVAFSGGGFLKGSLEGRVYKGNSLVQRVMLRLQ
jgi:hypothetical protein